MIRWTHVLALAAVVALCQQVGAEPDASPKAIAKQALSIYEAKDAFAAVEYLCTLDEPNQVTSVFETLMFDTYYKKKDLAAALIFGRAGHQHAMTLAEIVEDEKPKSAIALRQSAKAFVFNIASFTWPGWAEQGISVTDAQRAEGLVAARANLRLARDLKRGTMPRSTAHWMLGAHELAAGDYAASRESFARASTLAKGAGAEAEAKLSEAFGCLIDVLNSDARSAAEIRLEARLVELRKLKDGAFFATQVSAARGVFDRKRDAAGSD